MKTLKNNTWYKLPNGSQIFVVSYSDEDDYILFEPKTHNTTVHVGAPNIETGADLHVYFNDNLSIDMFGFRKKRPIYVIKNDEFPCIFDVNLHSSEGTVK